MVILANSTQDAISKTSVRQYFDSAIRNEPDEVTQVYINIACAILQQAVEDWRYLECGDVHKAIYLTNVIYYDELLNFFHSPWFEELLSYALPEYTPEDILPKLKIKN